jgi:hypothetical protein
MAGVAGNVLEKVADEGLGVDLTGSAELRALSQRALELRGVHGQGKARHRHHVAAEGVLAAQESAEIDHALSTHRRHLGRSAVLKDSHH